MSIVLPIIKALKKILKKNQKSACIILNYNVYYQSAQERALKNKTLRLIGQGVKTPPSHGGIRSSILLGGAKKNLN